MLRQSIVITATLPFASFSFDLHFRPICRHKKECSRSLYVLCCAYTNDDKMLELELRSGGRIIAADASTTDILKRGFYGNFEKGELQLSTEEALYLLDVRNAVCRQNGKELSFNELASRFWRFKQVHGALFHLQGLEGQGSCCGFEGQKMPSRTRPLSSSIQRRL